jgi:hypothetical protein
MEIIWRWAWLFFLVLEYVNFSLTHVVPIYLLFLRARLVFYMEMVRFGNIKGDKPRLGSIMSDS